jgi:large subunit ribosomal protein L10
MAKVAEHKKEKVKEFSKLIEENPIIGVVNMMNLPAKQLQKMREKLRETVFIRMTKQRLMKLAFENSKKPNINELVKHFKGLPALVFTKDNPFKLFNTLKKNKSTAPIKAGQTAPNDLIVKAGPTNFAPGPIIGELGGFGIVSGVENGKIAIKKDSVVAKEGDVVNAKLAALLQRLGVEPMEIGLDLIAVYENGEIITKDVLDIDVDEYVNNIKSAASMAFNLAVNAGFPTEQTTTVLLQKAASDALALARSQNILTSETVKDVLAKADSQAKALNSSLNIKEPVVETKEEVKTKAPAQEEQAPKVEEEAKETESKDETAQEETPSNDVASAQEEKPQSETPEDQS